MKLSTENGEEKKFAFDYSYWSFDGFKEEADGYCAPDPKHKNGKKFCVKAVICLLKSYKKKKPLHPICLNIMNTSICSNWT